MNKRTIFFAIIAVLALGLFAFFKWSAYGVALVGSFSQSEWLFPLITIAALLDSINPCALSILLITVVFLMSLGHSRSKIFLIGGLYIFGIYLVYLLIGLGLLKVLIIFGTPHVATKIAAVILSAVGIVAVLNHYFPKFPVKLKIPEVAHRRMGVLINKATLPGAFALGFFVGLCEFPCTGGPYLLVLGLLHDHATYTKGLFYLIYYNFVFVLPLVIVLFLASDQKLYAKVDAWRKSENPSLRLAVGVLMIILGFIMFAL